MLEGGRNDIWYGKKGIAKTTLTLGIITGVLVFIGTLPLGWGNAIGWGLLIGFGIALCGKVYHNGNIITILGV